MKVTLVLMEFLQRKYEYSQNIILVNKESGWALERAPLTALAVGFDSLHPCGNLTYSRDSASVTSPSSGLWAPGKCVVHVRHSQLYASFCLVLSTSVKTQI